MSRPRASTLIIAAVMLFYSTLAVVQFTGEDAATNWHSLVRSDVRGYYGYLRSVFLLHDLGHQPVSGEFVHATPSGTLNKYFAGESVMLVPFFLAAHGIATLTGQETDGMGRPYMAALCLAALFYTLLGLLALRSLFMAMGLREATICWVLAVIGFGTQLAQYAGYQPGWSHTYSFGAVSLFLLLVHRSANGGKRSTVIALGGLLGLIVLIRPVNGLVLLAIPVVLGARWWSWLTGLFRDRLALLLAAIAGFAVVFVQPLLWHAQTGHWFEWGYQGEGFYWTRPMTLRVLFGFRRGLFLWTPVMIAAAASLLWLWRTDRVRAVGALIYWSAITYVIGCWWVWYYGSGFGPRVFIEHYPVLVLPLALMLDRWAGKTKRVAQGFLVCATSFQLLQFWQYHHGILNEVGMDRHKYAFSFMRFGKEYQNALGGNDQEAPYHPNGLEERAHVQCDLEGGDCPNWANLRVVEHRDPARAGTHASLVDSAMEFGPTVTFAAGIIPAGQRGHVVIDLDRFEFHARGSFGTLAVLSVESPEGGKSYYETVPMDPVPGSTDSTWLHIHYEIPIPDPVMPGAEVRFYLWNKDHRTFLVDNLDATAFAVRPY